MICCSVELFSLHISIYVLQIVCNINWKTFFTFRVVYSLVGVSATIFVTKVVSHGVLFCRLSEIPKRTNDEVRSKYSSPLSVCIHLQCTYCYSLAKFPADILFTYTLTPSPPHSWSSACLVCVLVLLVYQVHP